MRSTLSDRTSDTCRGLDGVPLVTVLSPGQRSDAISRPGYVALDGGSNIVPFCGSVAYSCLEPPYPETERRSDDQIRPDQDPERC